MSRYALSLPQQLKQKAEEIAHQQGVSLNQFILWAVAEKVGALGESLADPAYPGIGYRRSAAGQPAAVLNGFGVRVRTLAACHLDWGMSPAEIAGEYDLPEGRVKEALAFYQTHQVEIDASLQAERELELAHG